MLRLEDLTLFVRAAALNSFSNTAREAGLQPAQISTAIKRLEKNLNIRLFARSTRSLRLTPEGEAWLPYAVQALQTLKVGYEKIQPNRNEVRGTLQIAVPSDLGRNMLLNVFQTFRYNHPGLSLKLFFSDQVTDVFKYPVDVAFRYGNNDDASFISLPIASENRRVVVASPAYLERYGEPKTINELAEHNSLFYMLHGRAYDNWTFYSHGNKHQVLVKGSIMSDDAEVIRRLVVDGEGIAYKSWLDVSEDVQEGRLKLLLPQYKGCNLPLSMICPHRKQISTTVKLLHEVVKARCTRALRSLPTIEDYNKKE
jgi:DNA-binding transcriptional LysR family regulator